MPLGPCIDTLEYSEGIMATKRNAVKRDRELPRNKKAGGTQEIVEDKTKKISPPCSNGMCGVRTLCNEAHVDQSSAGDPLLDWMQKNGQPLTRERYLALNGTPEPLHPEMEASLPPQLRLSARGEHEYCTP